LICKICTEKTSSSSNEENKQISEKYSKCVDLIQENSKFREKIENNKKKTKKYQRLMAEQEGQDLYLSLLSKKEELCAKHKQLKSSVDSLCQQIEDQETIYFESETFLMEEKIRLDSCKKKSLELYKALAIKQDENIQLSKTLDALDMRTSGKKKTEGQINRERSLRKAYEKLLETEKFFTDKNIQLSEELRNIERDMKEKDEELGKIEQEINNAQIEEDFLKQLNETLHEQQDLIKKLKQEIEANKIEPVESKNCNCLVF
jgi:chromosome segregation ATPase